VGPRVDKRGLGRKFRKRRLLDGTIADAPYKEVYSVWGRADDDVWAAGRIESWPETRPLLLHYDGAQWTEVRDAPSAGNGNVLVTGDARSLWLVTDDSRFFRFLPRAGAP
jgi:hypothetical protein